MSFCFHTLLRTPAFQLVKIDVSRLQGIEKDACVSPAGEGFHSTKIEIKLAPGPDPSTIEPEQQWERGQGHTNKLPRATRPIDSQSFVLRVRWSIISLSFVQISI
jgi:hypothetical protein